ncbi:phenoloxidase-activating factor 2-like isoform X1 [Penaeus monodon]|uniref:phenoloxidase-activating factor 2-like isoform X1 n=1 Tax=Penaeus monodon TaxID=6687 RepID=UPI0018A7061A|nr:phenoloxidase-activating factor 2-like isoform X1 [Penaeus monodon]
MQPSMTLFLCLFLASTTHSARLRRQQAGTTIAVSHISDEHLISLFEGSPEPPNPSPPGFSPGVSTSPPVSSFDPDATVTGACRCVKHWECADNNVGPQKENLVGDPRLSGIVGVVNLRHNGMCPDLQDVCCLSPIPTSVPTPTPKPHSPSCGTINGDGVILNFQGFPDNEAQFGQFPWMAALRTLRPLADDPSYGYIGGGSLVRPDVVMTAAHKVHDRETEDLVVRLGEWDFSSTSETIPYQEIAVLRVAVHPQFNSSTLAYNVALLFLEREATLGPTVDTVCLPDHDQFFDGAMCFSGGWGKDSFGRSGRYQEIIKAVKLPATNYKQCETIMRTTRLGRHFNLHPTFMCAGGLEGEDLCTGDGGAPLVCPGLTNPKQYVQVGISSWGIGCGSEGIPGVYASVSELIPWINNQLDAIIGFNPRNA